MLPLPLLLLDALINVFGSLGLGLAGHLFHRGSLGNRGVSYR